MKTLEMGTRREMSPNVRGISRMNRFPAIEVVGVGNRKGSNVIARLKLFGISVLAAFFLLSAVSEGTRAWLRDSDGNADAPRNFIVPNGLPSLPRISQPVVFEVAPKQRVRMLREENRYRVDMARENNRFINNLLNHAGRMAGKLSR